VNTTYTSMKLPAVFREGWLEALRDAHWQGRECYGSMSLPAGLYCALGLAAAINDVDPTAIQEGGAYEWLGQQGVDVDAVWHVFDHERMTFSQFADWLEAHSEPVE
jgi:hypothetical protein